MLDTVKINHVQHISFTQSRLTDAVSVILSELLSYEHPSKRVGSECYLQIIAAEIRVGLAAHGDIALTAAQHDDRRAGQAVVI